jgi:hypothetical protein
MRASLVVVFALAVSAVANARAMAQDPPAPIGPFVVDIRGTVPSFSQEHQLAESRGVSIAELPRFGLGAEAGLHLYFARWKAITFGVGAQATLGRAHSGARMLSGRQLRAVTETFRSFAPQLSFNFGSGDGWSYLSGGVGLSNWSIVPDGAAPRGVDLERLRTFNYGGGARWFMKRHVAFHVDVRFHEIHPPPPEPGFGLVPRTTMLIIGAGISLK